MVVALLLLLVGRQMQGGRGAGAAGQHKPGCPADADGLRLLTHVARGDTQIKGAIAEQGGRR